ILDDELESADDDGVSRVQFLFGDFQSVDVCAVCAPAILDVAGAFLHPEAAVLARDGGVIESNVGCLDAAENLGRREDIFRPRVAGNIGQCPHEGHETTTCLGKRISIWSCIIPGAARVSKNEAGFLWNWTGFRKSQTKCFFRLQL